MDSLNCLRRFVWIETLNTNSYVEGKKIIIIATQCTANLSDMFDNPIAPYSNRYHRKFKSTFVTFKLCVVFIFIDRFMHKKI